MYIFFTLSIYGNITSIDFHRFQSQNDPFKTLPEFVRSKYPWSRVNLRGFPMIYLSKMISNTMEIFNLSKFYRIFSSCATRINVTGTLVNFGPEFWLTLKTAGDFITVKSTRSLSTCSRNGKWCDRKQKATTLPRIERVSSSSLSYAYTFIFFSFLREENLFDISLKFSDL